MRQDQPTVNAIKLFGENLVFQIFLLIQIVYSLAETTRMGEQVNTN